MSEEQANSSGKRPDYLAYTVRVTVDGEEIYVMIQKLQSAALRGRPRVAETDRDTKSFAMSEPSLRDKAPPSLKRAGSIRENFTIANEARRAQEGVQRGSSMVKRQKPFPELKPNYADYLKRNSFNQEWLQQQRVAKLEELQRQSQFSESQRPHSGPSLER